MRLKNTKKRTYLNAFITADMIRYYLMLCCCLFAWSCKRPLPTERFRQYELVKSYEVSTDSLHIYLKNPLKCPLRIFAKSEDSLVSHALSEIFPLMLKPLEDSSLFVLADTSAPFRPETRIRFPSVFGNPDVTLQLSPISFPFLPNREYKIIQGYNGKFSHTSNYSRYALDFDMSVGDTVCAADRGVVIGVIEGYKYGGNNRKWRNFSNYITLFHPHTGLYTQYVHLKFEGSLVELGDSVDMGQAIGLSGKTGWTSIEHLHFNTLVPKKEEFRSIPIEFLGGIKGASLKRKNRVSR